MTITVYEFASVDPGTGQPLHPANKITRAHPLNASVPLDGGTVAVQVVPSVGVRLAIGGNPAAGDYAVAAGGLATFRIAPLSRPTIRATAG